MTDISRPGEGSTMYYSLWRVPARQRDDVCTLLQFINTLATTLHEVSEPNVAEQKIHWWHEEVERLGQGQPRHPSAVAVAPVLARHAIETKDFLPVLQANNQEKFHNAQTDAELGERLVQDYGTRLSLCERILRLAPSRTVSSDNQPQHDTGNGARDSSAQDSQDQSWAIGLGEVERLRQLAFLHHRAYPVFPDDAYKAVNLTAEALLQTEQQDAVRQLLSSRIDRAQAALEKALALNENSSASLPLITYARLRQKQLELWRRDPLKLTNQYTTLTPLKKFWISWRTGRQFRRQPLR